MKKIGIDLGSSSLGWVITEEGKIEKKGVVTFDTGMSKGESGGYVSPTRERRDARAKRNLIRARKYRKWELLKILVDCDLVPLKNEELEIWSKYQKGRICKFPENEKFLKWLACDFRYLENGEKYKNPYELRVKALDARNKLHKHEFGRALYHLVQRRGYKDIGETDKETEKQNIRRGESGFQKALEENDKIISKALLNDFLDNGKRARNQYPYRAEYGYELIKICEAQGYDISKSEKGNYNDDFIKKIWESIIWQRTLRTQKGNIGKCTLEPKKLRCPVSHPVYEIFRAWSFINTIKIVDKAKEGEKHFIEQTHRKHLFEELFLKKDKNFKFEDIKEFLNKKYGESKQYNYPITKDKKGNEIYDTSVSGMPVCKGLIDIFGDTAKQALSTIEIYNIGNQKENGGFGNEPKVIENYSVTDLWHAIFDFEETFLKKFAREKLKIENIIRKRKGEDVSISPLVELKSKFLQGYADLSLKAMCKIIPFLKDGYLYNEAVVLAKMPELLGTNWIEYKDKIIASAKDANAVYERNKLIIGVANNLIDKYKGLKENEQFAFKNYEYKLADDDMSEVVVACESAIGKQSWQKQNNQSEIVEAVKEKYQDFFADEKRAYRKAPTLTDIFNEKLKSLNINVDAKQLYHHSNNENIYLKKCRINKETDKKELPRAKNKNGSDVEILPQVQIDSIKNPMFNKSMSILRKLMNEFIKNEEIDKETEIVVEVARELNDNNKRIAIERYQNERKNNRAKYRECLEEFKKRENYNLNIEDSIPTFELWTEQTFEKTTDENGNEITNKKRIDILKEKDAIKRYELWMEQKGQCMYTGKMISLTKLFSGEIDIMHSIPRSLLPDDTMANITVGYKRYNRDLQKQRFPKECDNYYKDVDGWGTRIEPRLDKWKELRDDNKKKYEARLKSYGNEDENAKNKRIQDKHYFKMYYDYWREKVERFEAVGVKDSWARRQLVDTQMVSKYAREFLKTYFMKVTVQKGTVTATFRKIFGFQEEEEIKQRNRHTHHAIDALVLTLIPTNSSHREQILKEYFKAIEDGEKGKIKEIQRNEMPQSFNVQNFINEIEDSTLIYNYENDKILKQTKKIVRKRGKRQYLKDKDGKYILDKNSNKILLVSQGDTIRSGLYAQTFLGKIHDVERDENGKPKKNGNDWQYKTGNDEYCFVKRENIDKVKASDKSISSIVDPVIRKLVREQKNNSEIRDYQGNIIRHVRIRTKAGKVVKDRVNYRSQHYYKNKFYAEAKSIPYAILLQQFSQDGVKREMIPVASYEIAKIYKKIGAFDIEQYIQETNPEFANWRKQLMKVGQKVFVLKEDNEIEKINDINFQGDRLYVIAKFSEGSIWLKYHLEARSEDEIKKQIKEKKDELLYKHEQKYDIPKVVEDISILDNKTRKDDFENRKYRFDTIDKSFRLKRLSGIIGIKKTKEIKKELDKFKARPANIEKEGETYLLKMSKEKWNFLFEGKDFEMNIDGTIKFNELQIL